MQILQQQGHPCPMDTFLVIKKSSYFYLQVAVGLWRAIGGAEDEVENLSDSDCHTYIQNLPISICRWQWRSGE